MSNTLVPVAILGKLKKVKPGSLSSSVVSCFGFTHAKLGQDLFILVFSVS